MTPRDPSQPFDTLVVSMDSAWPIRFVMARLASHADQIEQILTLIRSGEIETISDDRITMSRIYNDDMSCYVSRAEHVLNIAVNDPSTKPQKTLVDLMFHLPLRKEDEDVTADLLTALGQLRMILSHADREPIVSTPYPPRSIYEFGPSLLPWRIAFRHFSQQAGIASTSMPHPLVDPIINAEDGSPMDATPELARLFRVAPSTVMMTFESNSQDSIFVGPQIYDHIADLSDLGIGPLETMRVLHEAHERGFIDRP